jgi:hypothetical protein
MGDGASRSITLTTARNCFGFVQRGISFKKFLLKSNKAPGAPDALDGEKQYVICKSSQKPKEASAFQGSFWVRKPISNGNVPASMFGRPLPRAFKEELGVGIVPEQIKRTFSIAAS